MVDLSFVTDFIAAHSTWAAPIVFVVAFGESFVFLSLLLPGTTILAACGALTPGGTLPIWPLLLGAIPGAILGDAVSFYLGRRYGPALAARWPLNRQPGLVARAEGFIRRRGVASIALGRFFGPLRAVVPLAAGMSGMAPAPFWLANIASAIVWAPAVMLPGALFGWAVG